MARRGPPGATARARAPRTARRGGRSLPCGDFAELGLFVEEVLLIEQQRRRRTVHHGTAGVVAADAERERHALVEVLERLPDEPVAHHRVEPDARLLVGHARRLALALRAAVRAAFARHQVEAAHRLVAGRLHGAAAEAGQPDLEAAA